MVLMLSSWHCHPDAAAPMLWSRCYIPMQASWCYSQNTTILMLWFQCYHPHASILMLPSKCYHLHTAILMLPSKHYCLNATTQILPSQGYSPDTRLLHQKNGSQMHIIALTFFRKAEKIDKWWEKFQKSKEQKRVLMLPSWCYHPDDTILMIPS